MSKTESSPHIPNPAYMRQWRMIGENALVVYKNKPALVREKAQDKITVVFFGGEKIKVREKDVEMAHPGPVKSFDEINGKNTAEQESQVLEGWELLLADGGKPVPLKELAELVYGEYTPASAWAAFRLLLDGLYFTGNISGICPRPEDQVKADEKKRKEKQRDETERNLFLERLKKRHPFPDAQNTEDRRFIQDIEALAYGKSAKSRTMKDIGLGETPEEAHALLLESGFWTNSINPHPARFGVSLFPAKNIPCFPPTENRTDLSGLPAFAIDSPWSHDPDDALSLQIDGDRRILYVHIADPAASITADSPCELEARDRGATLYIPDGSIRMLAEEALPLFALGLTELSPALTFKITLDPGGKIEETEIFSSTVKVSRISYEKADLLIANENNNDAVILQNLNSLAQRNLELRTAAGAINIDMPETHITVNEGRVTVEPIVRYQSTILVRECMLLAGEATGKWAMQRSLPMPYITQEIGDLPGKVLPGIAGAFQLRRCMRPRVLSTKPGLHCGLGLDVYTQATSPLRRYTDLLSHIQIRKALKGEPLISVDEIATKMFAGDAASAGINHAERASRNHWLNVYLSDKKDSTWEAVALEKKGNRWLVSIPDLSLETQVSVRGEIEPNQNIKLLLKSVNIPTGETAFAVV